MSFIASVFLFINMRLLKSKEKKERALQTKLSLKAYRCGSPKCAMVRRGTTPGMHGSKFRRAGSEFKIQLLEKQKIKFSYGLTETQIKRLFQESLRKKGSILEKITQKLEGRLDNVVFKFGFAPSRIMGRQIVSHGHILVNKRKVTIPSYVVRAGDVISIKESKKQSPLFKELSNVLKEKNIEGWLLVDPEKLEGIVKSLPKEVELPFDVNLVVDYYSR